MRLLVWLKHRVQGAGGTRLETRVKKLGSCCKESGAVLRFAFLLVGTGDSAGFLRQSTMTFVIEKKSGRRVERGGLVGEVFRNKMHRILSPSVWEKVRGKEEGESGCSFLGTWE